MSLNRNTSKFSFLIIVSLFSLSLTMKSQVPGYYINQKNDTIKGTLKPNYIATSDSVFWLKMQTEVDFTDGAGKKNNLNPSTNIKEIGFKVNTRLYKMKTFQGKNFEKMTFGFDDDEFKFIKVLLEGKINTYLFCRRNMSNNQTNQFTILNKPSTGDWGIVQFLKHKKLGKKFFSDCPTGLSHFEANDGIFDFYGCIDFYNKNCK